MSEAGVLVLLYLLGVAMLLAEIFIPSYGLLTVAGLAFLIWAIFNTFAYGGRDAGVIAILTSLVVLPTSAVLAIKYWHLTPVGRRIAPPNPIVKATDSSVPVAELTALVGRTGRSVSSLRPIGICEFDGRRVSCLAEFGMIEAGATVVATRISGGNLAVSEKKTA